MCDYSHRAAVVCHNTTADKVDTGNIYKYIHFM
jgi:hypothetical protein